MTILRLLFASRVGNFQFLKNWTLPIAMLCGGGGYFLLANCPLLEPVKPGLNSFVSYLVPLLIFMQLLLTFCKVELRELLPSPWHGRLLLIQVTATAALAALLIVVHMEGMYKEVFEGTMVCFICPTATAAAVITGKLGGNASGLTTYTLISNLLAAITVPLLFPLVEPHAELTFLSAFLKILGKVFPLLLFPFFLAMLFRYYLPAIQRFLIGFRDLAFYLWGISLAIVTAQTVRSLMTGDASVGVELLIALAGFVACALQFFLGKRIGTYYNDRISAGQALGQKNTVLAIWMANTYLDPVSSVAPGSYVLWQNAFNSWQLWKKRRNDSAQSSNS